MFAIHTLHARADEVETRDANDMALKTILEPHAILEVSIINNNRADLFATKVILATVSQARIDFGAADLEVPRHRSHARDFPVYS